jgi:GT2 family glycosyltransferase
MAATATSRAGPGEPLPNGAVFVVIPTFNRWKHTKHCVDLLQQQTYPSIVIIVSDGGSTDETRQKLAEDYPGVRLVHDQRERWWAGSTALGIDEAYRLGNDSGDYVLLLNNDTVIPRDYVETLVRVSKAEDAAVGAKIVDSRDYEVVLDAGEFIRWETYDFPVKTSIEPGVQICRTVDVLPGRGSLVPMRMLRTVGNVDDRAFPHYLADYDLFCRLKAAGYALCVTYETAILAHIEETGIKPSVGRSSFRAVWRELFSRRSMANVIHHWRFVSRHAPEHLRGKTRWLVVRRAIHRTVHGTPLAHLARPTLAVYVYCRSILGILRRLWRERDDPDSRFLLLQLPPPLPKIAQILAFPRPLSSVELREMGMDPLELESRGLIDVTAATGWWRLTTLRHKPGFEEIERLAQIAVPLSWNKVRQLRAYRAAKAPTGLAVSSPKSPEQ